ncbi:MAG: hypothetical protein SPJ05_05375, partial [Candidatus Limisoma sp.]|nr:hypothetical protein [Bacteroidales bacterium]MDY5999662.1 hypothetical protein [Candidatus Limisoma sp.]
MKKFLLSTMALVAAMTVSAATSTLDYTALGLANQTDLDGVAQTTAEGVSVTLAKGEGTNAPKY